MEAQPEKEGRQSQISKREGRCAEGTDGQTVIRKLDQKGEIARRSFSAPNFVKLHTSVVIPLMFPLKMGGYIYYDIA